MRQIHIYHTEDMPKPVNVVGESIAVLGAGDLSKEFEVHLQSGQKDGGPPPHTHPWDEGFYILEGEVEITLNGKATILKAGSYVHIPANTLHCYRNVTQGAKMLAVVSDPMGGEFFKNVHNLMPDNPEALPKLLKVGEDYGVEFKV